ncbi:Uncharacterised protein [Bordetella pertussis]|nr:Uncharacterised protein [Bordetella pertussis]
MNRRLVEIAIHLGRIIADRRPGGLGQVRRGALGQIGREHGLEALMDGAVVHADEAAEHLRGGPGAQRRGHGFPGRAHARGRTGQYRTDGLRPRGYPQAQAIVVVERPFARQGGIVRVGVGVRDGLQRVGGLHAVSSMLSCSIGDHGIERFVVV